VEPLEDVLARGRARSGSACCSRTGSARRPADPSPGRLSGHRRSLQIIIPTRPPNAATPRSRRDRLEVVALGVLERAVGLVVLVAGDVDLLGRCRRSSRRARRASARSSGAPCRRRGRRAARSRGRSRCRAAASSNSGCVAAFGIDRLVPVVGLGDVVDEPAREERGERELGVDDEVTPLVGALVQQRDQPLDHLLTCVLPLDRPHLRRPPPPAVSAHTQYYCVCADTGAR
jgi:hypothetical protein